MKTAGVEKDKFVDFITSQEVYKKFKSISNLTFDDLIEDMRNHMPRINEILNEVGEGGLYDNDEDKIKRVLELLYINLGNHIIKGYHELLTENFMENLFGFSGDKKELFENFIKTVTKYKSDPIKFYEYEIDRMRKISTKMIKKISKVFGLIDDKNKSIKDWDLHTKINKRTQIESEFKY
jgi:plasmid maintenance system antidote protein VapI